jgi:deoxyadenosine/deoxycytidine kinase
MSSFTLGILDRRWRNAVNKRTSKINRVLSICGPSGVGKTTVVSALAEEFPVYLETTEGNPHLTGLLEGRGDFNAAANQEWFLARISEHISHANPNAHLILDQDPAAVVLVYSRMFFEDGKITEARYAALLRRLLEIEEKLQAWVCPRAVLCLDASADVLRKRVVQRGGEPRTPRLLWFDRIRTHFLHLFSHFPGAIRVSTVDLLPQQVISRAKALIEDRDDAQV